MSGLDALLGELDSLAGSAARPPAPCPPTPCRCTLAAGADSRPVCTSSAAEATQVAQAVVQELGPGNHCEIGHVQAIPTGTPADAGPDLSSLMDDIVASPVIESRWTAPTSLLSRPLKQKPRLQSACCGWQQDGTAASGGGLSSLLDDLAALAPPSPLAAPLPAPLPAPAPVPAASSGSGSDPELARREAAAAEEVLLEAAAQFLAVSPPPLPSFANI